MRKKNGFTLVELLAVIVVLAIIMIIAIPAVLRVMTQARRSSFILYAEKVVNAVQSQYMYDSELGNIAGQGYYVYDITQDLSLTSTGSFVGYVVVDAFDVDEPHYILYLHDNNYMIVGRDITSEGMPENDSDVSTLNLKATVNSTLVSTIFSTSAYACEHSMDVAKDAYTATATDTSNTQEIRDAANSAVTAIGSMQCMNPEGYVIENVN